MKGIILSGGLGSRLYPITKVVTKQLLSIYNKPMIYYPLSTLMLAGIRDILIITRPDQVELYRSLFKDGSQIGINIEYEIQEDPKGIAECFIIGEDFIGGDDVCLILGDNIFYGDALPSVLRISKEIVSQGKSVVYGYHVKNPEEYGVVEYNRNYRVISIEEKPKKPKSNCAAVGLYMYNNDVIEIAKTIEPSSRGELEITDINKVYLKKRRLMLEIFGRGYAWFDAGSHDSLLEASNFIQTIEKRQGLKIACLEEISYNLGYISKRQLLRLADNLGENEYSEYLYGIS
tara:strand:- start:240 stop:1106 length:867 start_codon:yes stop_codon:yes gene_type:complete